MKKIREENKGLIGRIGWLKWDGREIEEEEIKGWLILIKKWKENL